MKVNLVIDGNYLLFKDVFILFDIKTLYSDLNNLLTKDLTTLKNMYSYDHIYFVSDSKMRWRQNYFNEYKQNRKHDSKIDWDFCFKEFDKFKEQVKSIPNLESYEVDWLEGDDLISYIVDENNKKGISNIIMAADSDIQQKVRFDLSMEYINIMFNYKYSDEKTYWPLNHNIFIKEMSKKSTNGLFDMNDDTEFISFLEELEFKTKTKEVSPEELLFCKMISGDKKDNVPSVYHKGDRGIGETGSLNIYKLYKELNHDEIIDFDSDIFIDKLTEVISYNKKITEDTIKNDIKQNLVRNRMLLKLDENYLPSDLRDNLIKKVLIY